MLSNTSVGVTRASHDPHSHGRRVQIIFITLVVGAAVGASMTVIVAFAMFPDVRLGPIRHLPTGSVARESGGSRSAGGADRDHVR